MSETPFLAWAQRSKSSGAWGCRALWRPPAGWLTCPGMLSLHVRGCLVLLPCADTVGSENRAFAPSWKLDPSLAGQTLLTCARVSANGRPLTPRRCRLGRWVVRGGRTPGHRGRGAGQLSRDPQTVGGQWLVPRSADLRSPRRGSWARLGRRIWGEEGPTPTVLPSALSPLPAPMEMMAPSS